MSILCALGLHRPATIPRWNGGYYFSICSGCGRDLVRTPFEKWHPVPQGYRVVWSPEPPPRVRTATLAADPATAAPREGERLPPAREPARAGASPSEIDSAARDSDLPISEVLRLLREDEAVPAGAARRQPGGTGFDDFMAEDPDFWGMAADHPPAAPAEAGPAADSEPALVLPDAPEPLVEGDTGAPEDAEPAEAEAEPVTPSEADDAEDAAPAAEPEVPAAAAAAPEPEPVPEPETDVFELPASTDLAALTEPAAAPAAGWAEPEEEPEPEPEQAVEPEPENVAEAPATAPPPAPPRSPASWPSAAPSQDRARIVGMDEGAQGSIHVGLVVAGAVILGAVAVLLASRVPHPQPSGAVGAHEAAVAASESASAPAIAGQPAYVTVRLLSCRASSVLQARPVRILARGDQVQVLAREPGWASVTVDGRQCWVVDRYLSSVPPAFGPAKRPCRCRSDGRDRARP